MALKNIPEISVLKFLRHSLNILKNPLPFHSKNFQEKGDTFRLNLGFGNSAVFSRDAGLLQYVLQKNQRNYTKSPIQTEDLAKYVGKGLLTAEGKHWQKQRKLIQPAFHKKQLTLLLDKIQSAITTEILKIETNTSFDIFPIFNDLAFQTVVKSLFSSTVDEAEMKRLQDITENAQMMLVKELRQPYLGWYFKLSGKIKANVDRTKEARGILKSLIDNRRAIATREDDLLDMLLDARYDDGTPMNDEQLIDEILILFTAGHETTSNALTFATQLIAQHPKVQAKIVAECAIAKENSKGDLMLFLKETSFTKNVIEEAMRMYPPAYFIDRINKEQDEFNGTRIPKGTNLLFSVIEIQNDKRFWKQPEKFDPTRFSRMKPKEYSGNYFPFGAGPRMCIGNNFAMYEMVIAIATLLENFSIKQKTSPIEITPLITLKPKNAFLEFENR